jgi:hypothetical protein
MAVHEMAATTSALFLRTAEVLGKSADLAEEHAERHERSGLLDRAAEERAVARRVRQEARRARADAERWARR